MTPKNNSSFSQRHLYKIHEKWKSPDIWAEFSPNIFTWQRLLFSAPVDTSHAESQFSHIPLNRVFVSMGHHSVWGVGAFPWTEATVLKPDASVTASFIISTKFQVQKHYISDSISSKWEKYPKLFQLPFKLATILTFFP